MLSFSFSTLIAFLLLYVPIAKTKEAWKDSAPCHSFYDKEKEKKLIGLKPNGEGVRDQMMHRWGGDIACIL